MHSKPHQQQKQQQQQQGTSTSSRRRTPRSASAPKHPVVPTSAPPQPTSSSTPVTPHQQQQLMQPSQQQQQHPQHAVSSASQQFSSKNNNNPPSILHTSPTTPHSHHHHPQQPQQQQQQVASTRFSGVSYQHNPYPKSAYDPPRLPTPTTTTTTTHTPDSPLVKQYPLPHQSHQSHQPHQQATTQTTTTTTTAPTTSSTSTTASGSRPSRRTSASNEQQPKVTASSPLPELDINGMTFSIYDKTLKIRYVVPADCITVTQGTRDYLSHADDPRWVREACAMVGESSPIYFVCSDYLKSGGGTSAGTNPCAAGSECVHFHADVWNKAVNAECVHVNHPISLTTQVTVERGHVLQVNSRCQADAGDITHHPSETVLVTKGSRDWLHNGRISGRRVYHCTHFHEHAVCALAERCAFIHAVTSTETSVASEEIFQFMPALPTFTQMSGSTSVRTTSVPFTQGTSQSTVFTSYGSMAMPHTPNTTVATSTSQTPSFSSSTTAKPTTTTTTSTTASPLSSSGKSTSTRARGPPPPPPLQQQSSTSTTATGTSQSSSAPSPID
eukprot:PhM_4_TR3094/c2_g2_i1/m.106802